MNDFRSFVRLYVKGAASKAKKFRTRVIFQDLLGILVLSGED